MTIPTARLPESSPPLPSLLARLSVTRFNANAGLASDVVVSIGLLAAGIYTNHSGFLAPLATVAFGLIVFSLIEYSFHRWLFHIGKSSMREGHDKHHDDPHGYDALPFFLPPLGVLLLAGLFDLFMPTSAALLLAGSTAAGYAGYGVAHTIIHAIRFRSRAAAKWASNHHIHHHHPDCNFGVTTPLWDIVLGTRYVPARTRVPATASDER
jgi:sterol desaturase/sphingolipid hydroxylase (fatty acid hydroxylase superfamily)